MQIGNFLKEVRKEKGLTIAQVAGDLLIQEKYIVAIESGNFEAIPGETYQRAYFNKYAEYLGVSEYLDNLAKPKEFGAAVEEQADEPAWGGEWDSARWVRVSLRILAILSVIILIPMGIRLMAKNNGNPTPQGPDNRVESTQQIHILPTDAYPLDFVHDPEPDQPATTPEPLTHEIILRANGECWVELKTRDSDLFKGTMVRGDEHTYNDIFGFALSTGKPEVLEVTFDGELVPWESGQFDMVLPEGASVFRDDSAAPEPEPEPVVAPADDTQPIEGASEGSEGSSTPGDDTETPSDDSN
jgi:transcriptional regulator with XRE-family HTH domain